MGDHVERRRRVAIFGGGFNPPHLAHLFTVTYLLSRADVDEVWLLPSAKHAFHKQMQPLSERVKLLESAFINDARVRVCLIEAEPEMSGLTYDTLDVLSERYPQSSFKLVIGADNLTESHRWHRFDELCARWSLIVLGRPGHEAALTSAMAHDWCDLGPTLMSVSSTEIRDALRSSMTAPNWHSEPLIWVPESTRTLVSKLYCDPIPPQESTEPSPKEAVFIWGSGRCGQALTQALRMTGVSVTLQSLRVLEDSASESHVHDELWPSIMLNAVQAEIWILACRDDDISRWASVLYDQVTMFNSKLTEVSTDTSTEPDYPRSSPLKRRVILHCSGGRSHEELRVLRTLDYEVARMHPLMSLRGSGDLEALREASYLVMGDPKACQAGEMLVHLLGGSTLSAPRAPYTMSEQERMTLYHCAAALGANLATVPLVLGEIIFTQLGYDRDETIKALRALYRVALSPQLTGQIDGSKSASAHWVDHLTGPVSRGDLSTVIQHLQGLTALSQTFNQTDTAHDQSQQSPHEVQGLHALPELYQSLSQMAAILSNQVFLAHKINNK